MTRTCSDCPSTITKKSKTGRCRSCAARANMANPQHREKLTSALRVVKASPEHRAIAAAASRGFHERLKDDPKFQATQRANGLRLRAQYDASAAAQAANLASRARAGQVHSARILKWCPAERRPHYRAIRKFVGAAEARRLIEEEIARDKARAKAAPETFESQMARIAAGAAVMAAPDFRTAGPAHTLGGVASGMI